MKYFLFFIVSIEMLMWSCTKSEPITNNITNPPPPPPPPPPPLSLNNSCRGYWVCFENSQLPNIFYAGGPVFAYGAVAVADSKVFFAGGHDEGDSYGGPVESVSIYSPKEKTWIDGSPLSIPRSRLAGVAVGSKVMFAGGNNSYGTQPIYSNADWSYFATVDIYDAKSLAHQTATLSEARAYMAALSCNNKAWFIGGKNNIRYSDRIDVYDPLNHSWSQLTLPRVRAHSGATAVNNKIFVAGGKNQMGNLKIVDVYDVTNNQWSTITAPNEHPYASVEMLNNKIFVAGGDGYLNKSVDIYDIASNTWTTAQLSDSRFDMAVGVANNKIIYLSGNYSEHLDVYNDLTGTWTVGSGSGVTGVVCGTLNNKCYFGGFLSDFGNTSIGTLLIIEP